MCELLHISEYILLVFMDLSVFYLSLRGYIPILHSKIKKNNIAMKKLLFLFAVLLTSVGAWAQTDKVTTINADKWYQLRCISTGHNNNKLADNGASLEGQSGTASFFQFVPTGDGNYYIKSFNSGKYIGGEVAPNADNNKDDSLDEQPTTKWTVTRYDANSEFVHISNGTKSYLNNAAGSNNLQIKYHDAISSTSNLCSLWYLTEYDSPITDLGEITANGTKTTTWTKYTWHVEENIPEEVINVEKTKYPDDDTAIRSVSFSISAKAGSLVSTLNYARGSNRLDILGADLLDASGNVVSEDYHFGYTGTEKENNTYKLKVENEGTYSIRYWVTFDYESNTSNGNINIYHSNDDLSDCSLKQLSNIGDISNKKSYFLRTSRGSLFHKSELSTLASTASYQSGVSKADARWAIYKHTDNRYYLYNLSTKKFVGKNSDEGGRFPMTDVSPLKDVLIVTSTKTGYPFVFSTDNYGAINHFSHTAAPGVANWKGNGSSGGLRSLDDDGSAHQIIEASDLTDEEITEIQAKLAAQTVTFTYSLKYNGTERLTQSCTESVGQPYPDVTVGLPYGIVAQKPEGTVVSEDKNRVVDVVLKDNLPFEISADYANAKWYFMINKNASEYLYHVGSQDYIALDRTNVDINNMDAYQWAFVGNPFDGFKIYNKLAGGGMILSSSTTMTKPETSTENGETITKIVDNDANVFPILTDAVNIPEGNNTYWMLTQSNNITTGFYIAQKDFPNNRMNHRNNKLAYWTGGADNGSTFVVENATWKEWLYEKDKLFWTSKNISIYPDGLNNTVACAGGKGNSSAHIGVEGHSVNKAEVMIYADAVNVFTTFKYRTNASHAIMPLGVDIVNKNGEVVASNYHLGFAGGDHFSNTYNFNVPESGTYILRFFVCNLAGNHDLGETHGKITVVGVKDPTTEQTNAFFAELKNTINGVYTSKYVPRKGETYGYYKKSTVEALGTALSKEIETAPDAGAIVDANDAIVFIIPKPGGFYRFSHDFGGEVGRLYVQAEASNVANKTNAMLMTDDNNGASSIFYYADDQMLSYSKALYVKESGNTRGLQEVASASNGRKAKFEQGTAAGQLGIYAGDSFHANTSGDVRYIDHCGSVHNADHDFTVEDVTSLPFTFNPAGLGFATFNAPVAVELPEGVLAYVTQIKLNNNTLQMYRLKDKVVPANTPVMLYCEAAKTEDATKELTIVSTYTGNEFDEFDDEFDDKKSFYGTIAAEPYPTGCTIYSLRKSAGKNTVGFYQKDSNTTLGGFKAWIKTTTSNARAFTIIFDGDDATGLKEALGLENENVEIYDLSGRRLDKPTKGVNVVGGKLVIK
jgi:hypothetical protein